MAKEKCEICGSELEKTFLDKLVGTIVKTGEGETSKKHFICSDCQKQHKNNFEGKLKE